MNQRVRKSEGITLTMEDRTTAEKPVPVPLFPPHILHAVQFLAV